MQIYVCFYKGDSGSIGGIIPLGSRFMVPDNEASSNPSDPEAEDRLSWEDTYAIALALSAQFPEIKLEEVSLGMIYHWTLGLEGFEDDPELANEDILSAIYQEWFEEANPV